MGKKGKSAPVPTKDELAFDEDGLNDEAKKLKINVFDDYAVLFTGNDHTHDDDAPEPKMIRSYGFDPNEELGVVFYSAAEKKWDFLDAYCYGALVDGKNIVTLCVEKEDNGSFKADLTKIPAKCLGTGK